VPIPWLLIIHMALERDLVLFATAFASPIASLGRCRETIERLQPERVVADVDFSRFVCRRVR
jgi:pheromone shutdown protein TraB